MNKLRKQFEKETLKNVGKELKYDCEQCANEMLIDTWNDEYVFWLEQKLKKLNEAADSEVNKCEHTGKINQGHHHDQPCWCDDCGEEL